MRNLKTAKQWDLHIEFKLAPKFLAINKIWLGENHVDILFNTNCNTHYLVHLEPGYYQVEFGELYGIGDLAYKNLTGTLINQYALQAFEMPRPGLINYKTKARTWQTFGHFTPNSMALWLNRGSYSPSIEIKC